MGGEYIYELEIIAQQFTLANRLKAVEIGLKFADEPEGVKRLRDEANKILDELFPEEKVAVPDKEVEVEEA